MKKRSKRYREHFKCFDPTKSHALQGAVGILKKFSPAKFDESVEVALRLGVDPKRSDQQVRGLVFLPHGTGKRLRIVVLAKGDKVVEALEGGADEAGGQELVDKIKGGWTDFDVLVVVPEMMRDVGKLGKILGPRGLMPTPKAGTVTTDVQRAIGDLKKGKIEFKVDKNGVINNYVGKLSFAEDHIVENVTSFMGAISKMKPASSKGLFLRSLFISSTMGAGIKVDINSIAV